MKNRVEDVAAVRAVIEQYIEGSSGNASLLRSIFHPDALMSGYFGGHPGIGSPDPFFEEVEKMDPNAPAGNYRGEIEAVEVIGDVATARLVETDFLGSGFVDFFHLIRLDGAWKIVSKTYHQEQ